jgi:hypothetical protein
MTNLLEENCAKNVEIIIKYIVKNILKNLIKKIDIQNINQMKEILNIRDIKIHVKRNIFNSRIKFNKKSIMIIHPFKYKILKF